MYKKISSILSISILAFSTYLSASVIDSNLRFDFGSDTGWGNLEKLSEPIDDYQSGLFSVTLNSSGEMLMAHVDGSIFLTPESLETTSGFGLPLIGQAFVGSSVTDGRNTVGITFQNQLLLPPEISISGLTVNDNNDNGEFDNSYQLVFIEREDLGAQNYDVEFRYDEIEWFANNNPYIPEGLTFNPEGGINLFEFRGGELSQVDAFGSETGGNVDEPSPGDDIPKSSGLGTSIDPFMPIIVEGDLGTTDWDFLFVADADTFYAIDPDVAVGYDYQVNSGPLFSGVKLPFGFDNDLFDISIWDSINAIWTLVETDLAAGAIFNFAAPVDRFRVTGIDVSNNVDPTSPTAFVTEIAFATAGQINMSQTAITQFVPIQVSAPGTIGLFVITLGFFALRRQRPLRRLA
jgi:hypothetical protein